MEYILFAFLALLCSAGTMIFDKLATKSISHLFSVFLRTLFMSVSSFIIILCFGHLGDMFNLSIEEWIYLVVSCLLCLSNCYFYFKAIKVAPIDSFSSFNQTGQLFFTNLLFLIFQFGAVINKDKPFSIVLYILGLVVLLGTMIFVSTNKTMNAKGKKAWLVYTVFSTISFSLINLLVKTKLAGVQADVITFYQFFFVCIVCLIVCFIKKEFNKNKGLHWQDYTKIFIASAINTGMMVFRFKALSYTNNNPSLVAIIIALDFVLISLYTLIFVKPPYRKQLIITVAFVLLGMALHFISGII